LYKEYPQFLHVTLEAVLSPDDDTVWGVAVDTFGMLVSTPSGRTLLISKQGITDQVLRKLGELIAVSSSDIRCRCLRVVKMMLSCEEDCKEEVSTTQQWFGKIHHHLLQLLLSIVRQPFADLRVAGLLVLMELSAQEWGQGEMHASPGCLEYLLDRNSEPDKDGKELKYEIVCRMVSSDCGERVWGKADMLKMRSYQREGPYCHTSSTSVAIEGAS
jgi:26S proteasome non-ATPase regulatory subunit 5